MKKIAASVITVLAALHLSAAVTSKPLRVEPLCWWTGMVTDLQIMVYGQNLSRITDVSIYPSDCGVAVEAFHKAESPDYLFIDVSIAPSAKAGDYHFTLRGDKRLKIEFPYTISERRKGSAERASFSSSDLLYLLMPDRFANGDPANDSVAELPEKASYDNKDGRHGGDIKGIIDHLDYLEDLGVTALWSTPMLLDNQNGYSYHGYAAADYYRIDPRYGTNELYRTLAAEAHKHGIKLVMDFVTNHCGTAHWWMSDLPFGDWVNHWDAFTRSNYAMSTLSDPYASVWDTVHCTKGWFDNSMPDLNLANPYLLKYLTQCAIWWIEWADIDGLRVDTFPYNDKNGIASWTAGVLAEYPRLAIVGECWFHEPDMIAYWHGRSKNADGYSSHLPMVMDFPLSDAIWSALQLDRAPGWNEGMVRVYNSLSHDYLYADPRELMIFLANHDTTRSADMADGSVAKMKLALTLLATMRGMPQMYTGDEVMMRADDLSGGDGAKRVDFRGGWAGDKENWFTAGGRSADQNEVFDHARRLFRWRRTASAIHDGRTMHFLPSANEYVFFRYDSSQKVMVIVNAAHEPLDIDWARYAEMVAAGTDGRDILSDRTVTAGQQLAVAPQSSMVIDFSYDK